MSRFWRHFVTNSHARLVEDHLGLFGHGSRTEKHGLKVRLVRADSPAAEAGLEKGDLLLALAETPVRTLAGLERLLLDLPVGIPLPVVFQRNGRRLERWLILTEHHDKVRR
ncbi:MAG TPA: PDZ domain-containing protein [Gemmataceae bacterium]|nr:PDZ domain-containing protein [Gemmataceae bacterium]